MREKFVIADTEHLCEMPYFEKDGMVYFIICYRETNMAYNEETENYERDNYFAFGCSPLFNGKVTISDYFMLHEQTINGVGLFGDCYVSVAVIGFGFGFGFGFRAVICLRDAFAVAVRAIVGD